MAFTSILPFYSTGGSIIIGEAPDKPRILYNNLMRTGSPSSVTPSSEPDPTNFPYQRAYDDRQFTFWLCGAGTQYLTFVFPSARSINAYGVFATSLAQAGASIQLQYSLDGGGSWLDLAPAEEPVDTTPIYRSFANAVPAARWRWKIISAVPVYIGCLAFGQDFEFQRGTWMGFSPPKLARDTALTTNLSQGGRWLGRSIINNGLASAFDLDKLTPSWVNDVWYPFILHAEKRPWWLLWEKSGHPAEAAWCWANPPIQKPANSHSNFMSAGMKFGGRTDDL